MPHCRAVASENMNRTVEVDNFITLTETSSVNIDTTQTLAAAALAAKPPTIEALDSATAPAFYNTPITTGAKV